MTKRMIHSYFLHSIIKMNSNHFLMENPDTHSQTKQHSSQRPKNPDNPCQNPQFSDVITLAGTSGLPAAFKLFFNLKPVAKKCTRKSPLNCRLKSRLYRLFSRNNHLKRYFLLAWTPLPQEPGNRSLNGQSEPVLRPEYLVYLASGSSLTLSGFWWCQTFLWTHVKAKTRGVFDRTGGYRHPNGARIGRIRESGAGKYPDSGCSERGISQGLDQF